MYISKKASRTHTPPSRCRSAQSKGTSSSTSHAAACKSAPASFTGLVGLEPLATAGSIEPAVGDGSRCEAQPRSWWPTCNAPAFLGDVER